MRPGQQNKRGRGRGGSGGGNNNNNNNGNRKGQNPLSRTYDSSGPDVKIRGTAQHIAEKYSNLARDAQSAGDRVMAENYLQHAEHYNRIIAAAQAQMQERFQRDDRDNQRDDREMQGRDGNDQNDTSDDDDFDGEANGNVAANGHGSQSRSQKSETVNGHAAQPAFDANAPQPVIAGTPAEVALEQDSSAESGRPSRRRGRPRRARSSETQGADDGDGGASAAPAEVAAAD